MGRGRKPFLSFQILEGAHDIYICIQEIEIYSLQQLDLDHLHSN